MDQDTKKEDSGNLGDMFNFWNKSMSTWQENMTKFSKGFADSFKGVFEKGTPENFLSAYHNLCSEVMQKSMEWQSDSPAADLYKKMLDSTNIYAQMLKSFAAFDGKPGETGIGNMQSFLDNWMGIQKNLFTNLFGGPLPHAFLKGGDLPDILKSSFETYRKSLSGMAVYFPPEAKPFIENYINILEKSATAFEGIKDPTKLSEFHDSWQKAYDDMVGKILRTPAIGPSRQFIETLKKDADSFFNYMTASAEFYTTLYKPGMEAIEATGKEASELYRDMSPDSYRKFYNFLLKNLEMKFFELFKSKGFGEVLKSTLNASLEFRTRHFEMIETMLKETPLVTHTEIDEVHEEVYKLKKRVKELEKIIKELKAAKAK
ncbi:MAG: poly(R)-hydroxyalkanoic acid synthase subunit PhaE [Planctomycetota bacterium]|jgi:hypothetical protein